MLWKPRWGHERKKELFVEKDVSLLQNSECSTSCHCTCTAQSRPQMPGTMAATLDRSSAGTWGMCCGDRNWPEWLTLNFFNPHDLAKSSLKFEICIQLKNAILQKPTDFTVWSPLNDVILSDKVGEVVWFTWIMWWFLFPRSCLTSTKRNAVVEKTIGQQFAPRTAFFRVPCSITNWDAILCSALQGIIDGKNKRLLTFMQATATSLQAGIPWNDPTDGAHLLWGSETVSFRGRASLFLYPRSFEFSGIWLWHFTLTCYKEDL